jgi:hypothetical protein
MSPRSWKPQTTHMTDTLNFTLNHENVNNYEKKTNYASMEIEKRIVESRQSSSSSLTIVTKLNEDLNDQMPSTKSTSSINKYTSNNIKKSNISLSTEKTSKSSVNSVRTNDTLEFRLKNDVSVRKPSTSSLPKSRPSSQLSFKTLTKKTFSVTPRSYSVMSRCETPSNRENLSRF